MGKPDNSRSLVFILNSICDKLSQQKLLDIKMIGIKGKTAKFLYIRKCSTVLIEV